MGHVLDFTLIGRFGSKPLLMAGFASIAGALVWFAQIDSGGGYVSDVLGPALLAGVGLGTTFVSVVTAATRDLSGGDESGLASGLVTTPSRWAVRCLAVLSTIAFARADTAMAEAPGNPGVMAAALTKGFQLAFYTGAGLAAAGCVVALLVTTGNHRTNNQTQ